MVNGNDLKIGKSLKRFRKEFKLTQENVAEATGISRPLYTKYECDKNMPSVDTVMKIAIAFGVPLDYLVGLSDEPNPIKLDEKTLAVVRAMQENFQPRQTVTV